MKTVLALLVGAGLVQGLIPPVEKKELQQELEAAESNLESVKSEMSAYEENENEETPEEPASELDDDTILSEAESFANGSFNSTDADSELEPSDIEFAEQESEVISQAAMWRFGNWCKGDDCVSRAWCPHGWYVTHCKSVGNTYGDGTYQGGRGRVCLARGRNRNNRLRAKAKCVRRQPGTFAYTYTLAGHRRRGTGVAKAPRCRRGDEVISCTCHSYWQKCRGAALGFNAKGKGKKAQCQAKIHKGHHWGQVYAICGRRWRVRRSNPLRKLAQAINRAERRLHHMERSLNGANLRAFRKKR